MYFATYAVHTPVAAKDSLIQKYLKMGLPEQGVDDAQYAAMHEHMDKAIGRILDYLDFTGLTKNTIIVFLSDNGGREPQTNNTPFRGGKGELLEGGIRVPMIFEWDGKILSGTVNNTPVAAYDLYPTLLDMVGVHQSENVKTDGVSIKNLLLHTGNGADLENRTFYWNYPHYTGKPYGKPSSAIRKGDWKLIYFLEDESMELYNLKTDTLEETNLVTKYPEKARELYQDLDKWRKEVNARIPTKNPKYNPSLPSGWPKSLAD